MRRGTVRAAPEEASRGLYEVVVELVGGEQVHFSPTEPVNVATDGEMVILPARELPPALQDPAVVVTYSTTLQKGGDEDPEPWEEEEEPTRGGVGILFGRAVAQVFLVYDEIVEDDG